MLTIRQVFRFYVNSAHGRPKKDKNGGFTLKFYFEARGYNFIHSFIHAHGEHIHAFCTHLSNPLAVVLDRGVIVCPNVLCISPGKALTSEKPGAYPIG